MTLLSEDPQLWDTVFVEQPARGQFIRRLARRVGLRILDVGCATGSLCRLLRQSGAHPVGVDINSKFIAAARSKDPGGEYFVGDMKSFRLRRRFDVLVCLGTTFSYNCTNAEVHICLRNFPAHLTREGCVVLDVLNAITLTGPRPFRRTTRHDFVHNGRRATATIEHHMNLKRQSLTEQVSWKMAGRRLRRDPPEELRLFFPQELAFHLEMAGFSEVKLMDGYAGASATFAGRRLLAVASLAHRKP